jgi:hypothetical protein
MPRLIPSRESRSTRAAREAAGAEDARLPRGTRPANGTVDAGLTRGTRLARMTRAARPAREAAGTEDARGFRPAREGLPLASPARGGDRTGFGVPAFAHPLVAPAEWAELARPGTPLHWVAFDVAGGPGTCSDPLYTEALGRVRENGVPVLGLLDCVHGARPFGQLVSDASHYLDWYRVDGFYLDRAPTLRVETAECRRVVTMLRALLGQEQERWRDREDGVPGGAPGGVAGGKPEDVAGQGPGGALNGAARPAPRHPRIVLAPGAYPDPGYAEFADQLVVFNGPWTRYRWSEVPEWSAAYPASRFAHLVHGLSAAHLDAALRIARWQGAGTVCMTDRTAADGADPWAGLPGYWREVLRKVR